VEFNKTIIMQAKFQLLAATWSWIEDKMCTVLVINNLGASKGWIKANPHLFLYLVCPQTPSFSSHHRSISSMAWIIKIHIHLDAFMWKIHIIKDYLAHFIF